MDVVVAPEDPRAPDVAALLAVHLAHMHSLSPACHVHALDLDGLLDPSITFLAARTSDADRTLVGVGALRMLDDPGHAEIKSMHVPEARRGLGIARTILHALLDLARARGCTRVSLETGTQGGFAPARALYAATGFVSCPPFGEYTDNEHSTCMTLVLAERPRSEAQA